MSTSNLVDYQTNCQ